MVRAGAHVGGLGSPAHSRAAHRIPAWPYDHGTEGFRQLERDDQARSHLEQRLGPAALPLLRAVTGHHGNLPTTDDPAPIGDAIPRRLRREDVAARRMFVEMVCDFFVTLGATLPWPAEVGGATSQRLAGLCAVDAVGTSAATWPGEHLALCAASFSHSAAWQARRNST